MDFTPILEVLSGEILKLHAVIPSPHVGVYNDGICHFLLYYASAGWSSNFPLHWEVILISWSIPNFIESKRGKF